MRAHEILARLRDVPPDVTIAISDLDSRAYFRNDQVILNDTHVFIRLMEAVKKAGS